MLMEKRSAHFFNRPIAEMLDLSKFLYTNFCINHNLQYDLILSNKYLVNIVMNLSAN